MSLAILQHRLAAAAHAEDSLQESWYALYVRSHFERAVEDCLKGKGYPAFSPHYQTIRKRLGRTKTLDLPLFPGYVFCCFNSHKRLPVLTTPGIVRVVGAGNVPEPVEISEIRSLQTVAESGRPVQPWPFLQKGQKIPFFTSAVYPLYIRGDRRAEDLRRRWFRR